MLFSRKTLLVVSLLAAGTLVACGGTTGPSGTSLKLQGVVQGSTSASSVHVTGVRAFSGGVGGITVTVQEDSSLTTSVSGNGTFEIDGVPPGGFTLVFSQNGVTLGTITISAIQGATDIKIVVNVTSNSVVLISLKTDNPSEPGGQDQQPSSCEIDGGVVGSSIELEGHVSSGSSASFMMDVNGNRSSGLVSIAASGATYKCNGNPNSQSKGGKKPGPSSSCQDNLKAGAQVHVSGTLTSCSPSSAAVTATEVKIQ